MSRAERRAARRASRRKLLVARRTSGDGTAHRYSVIIEIREDNPSVVWLVLEGAGERTECPMSATSAQEIADTLTSAATTAATLATGEPS